MPTYKVATEGLARTASGLTSTPAEDKYHSAHTNETCLRDPFPCLENRLHDTSSAEVAIDLQTARDEEIHDKDILEEFERAAVDDCRQPSTSSSRADHDRASGERRGHSFQQK